MTPTGELIDKRRGPPKQLGFALQLTTRSCRAQRNDPILPANARWPREQRPLPSCRERGARITQPAQQIDREYQTGRDRSRRSQTRVCGSPRRRRREVDDEAASISPEQSGAGSCKPNTSVAGRMGTEESQPPPSVAPEPIPSTEPEAPLPITPDETPSMMPEPTQSANAQLQILEESRRQRARSDRQDSQSLAGRALQPDYDRDLLPLLVRLREPRDGRLR